jgi:hypothetical protein
MLLWVFAEKAGGGEGRLDVGAENRQFGDAGTEDAAQQLPMLHSLTDHVLSAKRLRIDVYIFWGQNVR